MIAVMSVGGCGRRISPNFNTAPVAWRQVARSEGAGVKFSRDGQRALAQWSLVEGTLERYSSREFLYNFKHKSKSAQAVVWDLKSARAIDQSSVGIVRLKKWGPWQTDPIKVDVKSPHFQKYSGEYFDKIDTWDFSLDGKLLAFSRPCMVDVWDSKCKRRLSAYRHMGYWGTVRFGPDSKTVACFFLNGSKPHVINARTGKAIRYPRWVYRVLNKRGAEYIPSVFAFTRDGKLIAKTREDEQTVEIWTTPVKDAGRKLRTVRTPLLRVESLQFSPDGQTLAISGVSSTDKPVQFVSVPKA